MVSSYVVNRFKPIGHVFFAIIKATYKYLHLKCTVYRHAEPRSRNVTKNGYLSEELNPMEDFLKTIADLGIGMISIGREKLEAKIKEWTVRSVVRR